MPKPRRKAKKRKKVSYLKPLDDVGAAMLRHPLAQKRPGSQGLRIVVPKSGKCFLKGLRKDFAKYEKAIIEGEIPCPFTVEFKNTTYGKPTFSKVNTSGSWPVKRKGQVVCSKPLPLTPEGKPKILIF